jgi:hypothetical protein
MVHSFDEHRGGGGVSPNELGTEFAGARFSAGCLGTNALGDEPTLFGSPGRAR